MPSNSPRQLTGLFAGGLIGFIAERLPQLVGLLPPGAGILLGMAASGALMRPAPDWRTVACMTRETTWARRLGMAAAWGLAAAAAVTAINIPCSLLTAHFFPTAPAHPLLDATKGLEWRTIPIAACSLCIVTPVAEELFFRRLLPSALQTLRIAEKPACLIAVVIFAAIHLPPAAFPGLFSFGLLLSWQLKRHDLIQPILIHGFYNAFVLLVVIGIKLIQQNGG